MQIVGNVISVTLSTKVPKQGGGTYDAWELVYRNPENEVKQLAKPVQGLKFTKGLKEGLESLKPGDNFVAETEKGATGYWEVKSVSVAAEGDIPAKQEVKDSRPALQSAPRATGGKVTGSTYETAEERAKKQVVIVRQSSIDYAIKFLVAAAQEVTLESVISVAKEFEKFVQKDVGKSATKYLAIKIGEEE